MSLPPRRKKPYGVNGSPPSKYHIEVATGAHDTQELQVTSTTTLQSGAFGLAFEGERTDCIETVEQALESLSKIDGVSVTMSAQSDSLLNYDITFNGTSVANKDQPLLEIDYSAVCTQSLDSGIEIKVRFLQDGAEMFRLLSFALSLSTKTTRKIQSVGYKSNHDMLVSVGNQPAQFMVGPGSRWVDTMGDDLTSVLHIPVRR